MTNEKKELFDWFKVFENRSEKKFTEKEVKKLIEDVKVFNAGAIDKYLSEHVDEVFEKWLKDYKK